MAKDLRRLLEQGEDARPTDAEIVILDSELNSVDGEQARAWVKTLPDEEPSLAWRSALNERLLREQPKLRRRAGLLQPIWGLAAAAAIAAVVVWNSWPRSVEQGPAATSLEAALVSAHLESVQGAEIAGAGMGPHDLATAHSPAPAAAPFDWNEMDLETL